MRFLLGDIPQRPDVFVVVTEVPAFVVVYFAVVIVVCIIARDVRAIVGNAGGPQWVVDVEAIVDDGYFHGVPEDGEMRGLVKPDKAPGAGIRFLGLRKHGKQQAAKKKL
jgi:hypothetical protein